MDNVMSYAGMLRLLRKNLFQNRTGLFLIRISFISGGRAALQRERVKDGCLPVIGIASLKLLHRFFICHRAGVMVQLVGIFVDSFEDSDVIPLALRFWRCLLGLGNR